VAVTLSKEMVKASRTTCQHRRHQQRQGDLEEGLDPVGAQAERRLLIDPLDAEQARLHHQHDIGQGQHDMAHQQHDEGARGMQPADEEQRPTASTVSGISTGATIRVLTNSLPGNS
jgi:hypothetical protein